jgi:hypothetical protein
MMQWKIKEIATNEEIGSSCIKSNFEGHDKEENEADTT